MMLLVTGFFVGIIYANRVKVETVIFNERVLACFKGYELDYIIRERVGMLLLVVFLGQVQWKNIYGGLITTTIGVLFGSLVSMAICNMKLKGLLVVVIGLFPHAIFYGVAYMILICYWMDEKKGRWTGTKTLGLVLFMSLGILAEAYLNSFLFKAIW